MGIFRFIGSGLLLLGSIAGFLIFLLSFQATPKDSYGALWPLFILSFLSGCILFSLGSNKNSTTKLLKTAAFILLLLGLLSAVTLFLNALDVVKPGSLVALWTLFLLCTIVGIIVVGSTKGLPSDNE